MDQIAVLFPHVMWVRWLLQGNPVHQSWKGRWERMGTPLRWTWSSKMTAAPPSDTTWSSTERWVASFPRPSVTLPPWLLPCKNIRCQVGKCGYHITLSLVGNSWAFIRVLNPKMNLQLLNYVHTGTIWKLPKCLEWSQTHIMIDLSDTWTSHFAIT
jgi:hypothetical protein